MAEPLGLFAPNVVANHEGYNRHNTIAACDRVGGRHVVFVNDWEACRDWLARGGIAAHRVKTDTWNDDDGDNHFDAAAYVDHVHHELSVAESALPQQYRLKGVVYLGNELGTGTKERTDAWGEKGTNRATELARKVVFGNWAYKNIPPSLPKTIAALRRNGGWMGWHEGTTAKQPLAPDAFADGAIGGFIAWKQQHGIPCWITEFAGSLTAHDGWKALYNNDWRRWAAQIEWALKHIYAPHNAPVSEFTLNKWDLGRGFEFIDVPEFLDELARLNRSYVFNMTQTIPKPTGEATPRKVTGFPPNVPFRNIRKQPKVTDAASDVGDLKVGDTILVYFDEGVDDWFYIERGSDGVEGWVLFTGVETTSPDPVEPPTLPAGARILTAEEYQELQALHAAQNAANASLGSFIERIAPPLLPGGGF